MADDWMREIGLKLPDLVAGFSGGVVNAVVFRRSTPWAIIGSVIVGALTANYLGEVIGKALGMSGGAAAFVTGLAGMALCQGVVEAAKKWRPGWSGGSNGGGAGNA